MALCLPGFHFEDIPAARQSCTFVSANLHQTRYILPLFASEVIHSDVFPSYTGIAACLGVYAVWHWSMGNLQSHTNGFWIQQPSPEQRATFDNLTKHFTLKLDDVKRERWWTLITPAFSHVQHDHILGNLCAFSTF